MTDFLFRGSLEDLDPAVYELTQLEAERQYRKLILIPSESAAPLAVREALGSAFQNLYAEGYPDEETRTMGEEELLSYDERLAHYRRYADPRYYKGVEYADAVNPWHGGAALRSLRPRPTRPSGCLSTSSRCRGPRPIMPCIPRCSTLAMSSWA